MFIPAAVQLEMLVSNAHAKTAFNQCFLWLHIAASVTVAMPLKKKNKPMRISADLFKIGARAYMWKSAIRLKAPRTPSDRATTTGTPYFGRPYRKGAYAREVHGEAKALCHVSDLANVSYYSRSPQVRRITRSQSNYLLSTTDRKVLDYSYIEAPAVYLSRLYILPTVLRMPGPLVCFGEVIAGQQISQYVQPVVQAR